MQEKLLTISIAAFNVEHCIRKALDSIVSAKRIDDIEILIVNDGSEDGTAEIGAEYEKRFPDSIRLISKSNGGHGSTINTGIENAHGKYFRALDADDWVETDNLDGLIERLSDIDVDMILCNYNECIGDKVIFMQDFKEIEDNHKYQFNEIINSIQWMCYHSLIFKVSILKEYKIRLDEHCFYVDNEYAMYPLPYVNSFVFYSKPIYCYRIGVDEQSISATSRMKHIQDSKRVSYHVVRFLNEIESEINKSLYTYLERNVSRICAWHFNSLLYFAPDNEKRKEIAHYDYMIKKKNISVYHGMLQYYKETKSL